MQRTARLALGVEHMTKPQEAPVRERKPIPLFQGPRHFEGVAKRDGKTGLRADLVQHLTPERHQPAHAWIFYDECRRIATVLPNRRDEFIHERRSFS
jgi:hypothetical protein